MKLHQRLQHKDTWVYALIIALALAGAGLLYYDMRWGPWAFSDSAAYIAAARSLSTGNGFGFKAPSGQFLALNLHQPFYPLVLSLFLYLDIHPFTTTLLINLATFAGSILILGVGIYRFSGSKWLTISTLALFICSPHVINNFTGAMSEPFYIFFTLAFFFALLAYVNSRNPIFFWAAAICAGLSLFTRFIGLVNVALGLFILILSLKNKRWSALLKPAIFGLISIVPISAWSILQAGPASGRNWFFPIDLLQILLSFIQKTALEIAVWFPYGKIWLSSPANALVIGLLFFALVTLLIWRGTFQETRPVEQTGMPLPTAAYWMILFYLGAFFASYAFTTVQPDIIQRTLIPLQPFFYLLLFASLLFSWKNCKSHLCMLIATLLLAVLLFENGGESLKLVQDRHKEGSGYTAYYWRASTLLEAARSLPQNTVLISNQPELLLLYMERYPYDIIPSLPGIVDRGVQTFGDGTDPLEIVFREEKAALVLFEPQFKGALRNLLGDKGDTIAKEMKAELTLAQKTIDGEIYYYK
ncbi:MAG: hypothetical protein CVU39_08465 [Chloroflexi bacterium HGW-Chloroflexi-10]|nr:MAG: hypothetical protein CVU39_08465 [Chloroflexi bacterium HGW-Chloroflexi-10]